MKKLTLLAAAVALLFTTNAQTADEIVDTYLENIGGKEALRKLEGTQMFASVQQQGMEIPLEIVQLKDGRQFTTFEFQGKKMTQGAFDGETSWGINFMTGKAEANTTEQTENVKRSIQEFPDPLLDYKDKGFTIEYLGKETVEGVECFKLKVTKTPQLLDGKEVENVNYYYFDTDNYVPIVVETPINQGPMAGNVSQTVFSDYDEVDGLYFAFSITQKMKGSPQGQEIKMTKLVLNPEVEDSAFKMPEEEAETETPKK